MSDTPGWKVKLDQGRYWLFRKVGSYWVPIDGFKDAAAAWKAAKVEPGIVEGIASGAPAPRPAPAPASVFDGLDIGAFINAEIKEMNNG